jgi:hypothetical protein
MCVCVCVLFVHRRSKSSSPFTVICRKEMSTQNAFKNINNLNYLLPPPFTEYRIDFLHLKNSCPSKSVCHRPMTMYIKMKYSNHLVLFFDHWIHSIAFYMTKKWERTTCENIVGEDDHFSLPEGVVPLFWTSPNNTLSTAAGLGL